MSRRLLPSLLFIVLIVNAPSMPAAAGAGEAPQVAVIRPERLPRPYAPAKAPPRDPFNWSREQISRFKDQEPLVKTNSAAGLTLSGIIWDQDKPLAVINDRVCAVGDVVQGGKILEIMKDMVVFEKDGLYHTLWLVNGALPAVDAGSGK